MEEIAIKVTAIELLTSGLTLEDSEALLQQIGTSIHSCSWKKIAQFLAQHPYPFETHLNLFRLIFPEWQTHPETAIVWQPSVTSKKNTNISRFMDAVGLSSIKEFHAWTVSSLDIFLMTIIKELKIVFKTPPLFAYDLTKGLESPTWFPGAKMNITDSCFNGDKNKTAIIYLNREHQYEMVNYETLHKMANQIAHSLIAQQFRAGDAIGIMMPMNPTAVAIYLGIIKMGGIVVSIADSFSIDEIAIRLNISQAKALFTQDVNHWDGKKIPLYEKVKKIPLGATNPFRTILYVTDGTAPTLRIDDLTWNEFLVSNDSAISISCLAMDPCNILFSSGTTGVPKAIVWNHTTIIKSAMDAYLHHNIVADDVLAWPTNLGWMMGPWLIFAALINQASIALYTDVPKNRAFGKFIENAKVTMLGVVPTLVANWRETKCMENLNWQHIKCFSSTGECSNAEDTLYLMSLANYKPVIEYCGGTEIGGAYVSSTLIEDNAPATFSTPTMGTCFILLNEKHEPATQGEVALIPPILGLSTQTLNTDHYQVYFAKMPTYQGKPLRRHGDHLIRYENGYYSVLGRIDDTMNLSGIKISAVEIERAIAGIPHIIETAAIAVFAPSKLIIYVATEIELEKNKILSLLQQRINQSLNPLFKIHDIIFVKELPKTASNKIMRRVLREMYIKK